MGKKVLSKNLQVCFLSFEAADLNLVGIIMSWAGFWLNSDLSRIIVHLHLSDSLKKHYYMPILLPWLNNLDIILCQVLIVTSQNDFDLTCQLVKHTLRLIIIFELPKQCVKWSTIYELLIWSDIILTALCLGKVKKYMIYCDKCHAVFEPH